VHLRARGCVDPYIYIYIYMNMNTHLRPDASLIMYLQYRSCQMSTVYSTNPSDGAICFRIHSKAASPQQLCFDAFYSIFIICSSICTEHAYTCHNHLYRIVMDVLES